MLDRSLFRDRTQVEERMTEVIRKRVADQTGMVFPVDEGERVHRQRVLDP